MVYNGFGWASTGLSLTDARTCHIQLVGSTLSLSKGVVYNCFARASTGLSLTDYGLVTLSLAKGVVYNGFGRASMEAQPDRWKDLSS
ncbi:MAG: hypothetical protein BGO09_09525 [Bacteroidetes bacterium 47-18]|nr:MAG: hypothetical protein BGO09_09525 [Bacteroidetes bacterium 47-18]